MARREDPVVEAHLQWLGYVQPTGLVVSALALARAGAVLPRATVARHARFLAALQQDEAGPRIADFRAFARSFLQWSFSPRFYAGTEARPVPEELRVQLPGEPAPLQPTLAVAEPSLQEGASPWQMLVLELPEEAEPDRPAPGEHRSPHQRLERLLRETRVPAGLLVHPRLLRLVSAPPGESTGWIDFRVADMASADGRLIAAALELLLGGARLVTLPREKRLAALLRESRRYQNEVTEELAGQVLGALHELLRGVQAADEAVRGALLGELRRTDPDAIYRGLLTVLLRLVFLLYAEERGMMPDTETYQVGYSLGGLYERLRRDAAQHPDTMDQRYGAWAQLLALFRLVHDGLRSEGVEVPARRGALFDPDAHPFLEGRRPGAARQLGERIEPPRIADGTVHRVLERLLVLRGERLSYRALDVEQIGSVYEAVMGFRIEVAEGPTLCLRVGGVPVPVDLGELLRTPPARRAAWLASATGYKPTGAVAQALRRAEDIEALHAALERRVDRNASPDVLLPGALLLRPTDERRRTGSHYTPRSLTEPIVRETLRPLLEALREGERPPRPEAILQLRVCDPAMGSGAFLVETCRQLGEALLEAWQAHGGLPEGLPGDMDALLLARRLVAQRCLYGVDRNPLAVDLARLSLWLVTLARDHRFTFLDHALRAGDALLGLPRRAIEVFHWDPDEQKGLQIGVESRWVRQAVQRAHALRQRIRQASEQVGDEALRELWREADEALLRVRRAGDLLLEAFLSADKPAARERRRLGYADDIVRERDAQHALRLEEARQAHPPFAPFHWEVEFPEVFERERPGFDAFVGNPPFAGKNTLAAANPAGYPAWLKQMHPGSHGNADLVAHFFRRAFALLRPGGTFGLVATNTIAQGDTRASGLRWIATHGGTLYAARRRLRWPGQAAVVVSVVHVRKGPHPGPCRLDGHEVPRITAFLVSRGGHEDPARLPENAGKSFQGSIVLGMGFTFDDTDKKGVATPLSELWRLLGGDPADLPNDPEARIAALDARLREHPRYREVVFPYLGGQELNTHPAQRHHRYVIHFGDRAEATCRARWPELMAIVEAKVKPERMKQRDPGARAKWWQFIRPRPELTAAIAGLDRVLAVARVGQHAAFTFLPTGMVYSDALIVFPLTTDAAFCALQARPHEVWARLFASSMKDDLRYTPSDCFETFPFPEGWTEDARLQAAGRAYEAHRRAVMRARGEGLTKVYNRFHDPAERDEDIERLRALHAAMDRAVLDAYGWTDLPTDPAAYDFLLDHADDAGEGRRRRPYRYRWRDEVQEEVLACLLELNAARARR